MEQSLPQGPERQLQSAPLEPLGHPAAGLEAAVSEDAEDARKEGPGDGTVRSGGRGHGVCVGPRGPAVLTRGWGSG